MAFRYWKEQFAALTHALTADESAAVPGAELAPGEALSSGESLQMAEPARVGTNSSEAD
jgi:hypothetical protein